MNKYLKILAGAGLMALTGCNGGDESADAYGNFEADELTVSAETGGKLLEMNIQEGENLDSGAVAALVDTTQLYLRQQQLKASIEAARSRLPNRATQLAVYDEQISKLEREVKRQQALVEANAAPSKQLDDLQAELTLFRRKRTAAASTLNTQTASTNAELEPLRYQLLQVEDQLARSRIINPIRGTVLTTMAMRGELVGPGRPVYRIASLDPIILKAYVSEDLLSGLKLGQDVRVLSDGADGELEEHTGTLTWISSEAEFTPKMIQTRDERTTQVYALKISVPNDGSLKIGMPGEAYFDVVKKDEQ